MEQNHLESEQQPTKLAVVDFEFDDQHALILYNPEFSRQLYQDIRDAPNGVRQNYSGLTHRHEGDRFIGIFSLGYIGPELILNTQYVVDRATTKILGLIHEHTNRDVTFDRVVIRDLLRGQAKTEMNIQDVTMEARVVEQGLTALMNCQPENFM